MWLCNETDPINITGCCVRKLMYSLCSTAASGQQANIPPTQCAETETTNDKSNSIMSSLLTNIRKFNYCGQALYNNDVCLCTEGNMSAHVGVYCQILGLIDISVHSSL